LSASNAALVVAQSAGALHDFTQLFPGTPGTGAHTYALLEKDDLHSASVLQPR
jgi:hypothetical protein